MNGPDIWAEFAALRDKLGRLEVEVHGGEIDARALEQNVEALRNDLSRLETDTKETFVRFATSIERRVTMDRYRPTELIAFGLVGLVTAGVIGALVSLLLQGRSTP